MSDLAQNSAKRLQDERRIFGLPAVAHANPYSQGARRNLVSTIAFVTLTLAMNTPSEAAITGYIDQAKIIKTILDDKSISNAVNKGEIISIIETNRGYLIISDDCQIDVIITHMIAARPGPTPFTLRIDNIQCIP